MTAPDKDEKTRRPHASGLAAPYIASFSAQGRRAENQDKVAAFATPFGVCCLVADGMGGHAGGAQASATVAEGYRFCLQNTPHDSSLNTALEYATAHVNDQLQRHANALTEGARPPGSTVVLALLQETAGGTEFTLGHVGDSRAYLWREGRLRLLTKDHSVVQGLIDAGIVRQEEAHHHPHASLLTRALGQDKDPQIQIVHSQRLLDDDVLLLCTDGLWGAMESEELEAAVAHALRAGESFESAADKLIHAALDAGSTDNVTVQVIRAPERRATTTEQSGNEAADAAPASRRWPLLLVCLSLALAVVGAVVMFQRIQQTPAVVIRDPKPKPIREAHRPASPWHAPGNNTHP